MQPNRNHLQIVADELKFIEEKKDYFSRLIGDTNEAKRVYNQWIIENYEYIRKLINGESKK